MYNGEHSITFTLTDGSNDVNTWTDWFLIPTSRPSLAIAPVYSKYVDVPGRSGSYDLSDYLGTPVSHKDRSGSFEFLVDNDHEDWQTIYLKVLLYLHGQRLRMILTDDPDWYYEGRFSVNEFRSEAKNSRITINYRVSPQRYPVSSS